MSRNQRFALLAVAVVVVVGGFAVARSGRDDSSSTTSSTPAVPPVAAATTPRTAEPAPPTPTPTAVLLTAGSVKTIRANKGEMIRFRARSKTADEVHVHGYDLMKEAPADKTISFSFEASIEGIFEVEFEDAGVQIAKLIVNP